MSIKRLSTLVFSGLVIITGAFSSLAFAEEAAGAGILQNEDMQKSMLKMLDVKTCIENVDQAELATLSNEARNLKAQLKQYCDAGSKDKARSLALEFAAKIGKSPMAKQLSACAKGMPDMLRGQIKSFDMASMKSQMEAQDVCSNLDKF